MSLTVCLKRSLATKNDLSYSSALTKRAQELVCISSSWEGTIRSFVTHCVNITHQVITMTMMMMIGSACAPLQHFARGNTFSLPPRPPHLLLRCFSDFSRSKARSHQDHLYMRRFSEWDFSDMNSVHLTH